MPILRKPYELNRKEKKSRLEAVILKLIFPTMKMNSYYL